MHVSDTHDRLLDYYSYSRDDTREHPRGLGELDETPLRGRLGSSRLLVLNRYSDFPTLRVSFTFSFSAFIWVRLLSFDFRGFSRGDLTDEDLTCARGSIDLATSFRVLADSRDNFRELFLSVFGNSELYVCSRSREFHVPRSVCNFHFNSIL